jgi:hypothetical protein
VFNFKPVPVLEVPSVHGYCWAQQGQEFVGFYDGLNSLGQAKVNFAWTPPVKETQGEWFSRLQKLV